MPESPCRASNTLSLEKYWWSLVATLTCPTADTTAAAVGSLDRETAGRPSRVRFANAGGVPALTTNLRVAKLVQGCQSRRRLARSSSVVI